MLTSWLYFLAQFPDLIQVVWSYVWEILILKESLNLVSAMGGVCVTAGVLVVASNAPPHVSRRQAATLSISRCANMSAHSQTRQQGASRTPTHGRSKFSILPLLARRLMFAALHQPPVHVHECVCCTDAPRRSSSGGEEPVHLKYRILPSTDVQVSGPVQWAMGGWMVSHNPCE